MRAEIERQRQPARRQTVREVFMIHVGGTCCVPFSTDNNMNIQARIILNDEVIRTLYEPVFVYVYLMCKYKDE
jgi:hypothetical protein